MNERRKLYGEVQRGSFNYCCVEQKIFQLVLFNEDKAKTCGLLGQVTIKYGYNLGHKDGIKI